MAFNVTNQDEALTPAKKDDVISSGTYIEVVYLGLAAIVGLAGNTLLIGVVAYSRKLRTLANVFVVNVAVADLITTGYIIPVVIANNISQHQLLGPIFCSLNGCILMICGGVSISSLQFIALNRYLAICKKAWYYRLFTRAKTAGIIGAIWGYVTLGSTPMLYRWGEVRYIKKLNMCAFYHAASLSYTIFAIAVGILGPITVTFFCYIQIYLAVKNSRKTVAAHAHSVGPSSVNVERKQVASNGFTAPPKKQHKERQLLVSFVVFLVFALFWLPYCCAALADVNDNMSPGGWRAILWLALSNSSLNWAIYGFLNRNFRDAYKEFICCKRTI